MRYERGRVERLGPEQGPSKVICPGITNSLLEIGYSFLNPLIDDPMMWVEVRKRFIPNVTEQLREERVIGFLP